MKFILGTKLGMTRIPDKEGRMIPATVLEVGPCTVTQIKTRDKDGYDAVQLGFGETRKLTKPQLGHVRELGKFRWLREFRTNVGVELKRGDVVGVSQFAVGDVVHARGVSKGKGFQGTVKRWGFAGGPRSHGTEHTLRAPGSIGSMFPQRVLRGKKMSGHMGSEKSTVRNLRVLAVEPELNVLALKGAIPGTRKSLIILEGK